MNNRDIADILSETAKLMELHGVNEFKIKSMQNAAFTIGRLESPLAGFTREELEQIKGIGKSISEKVIQIVQAGTLPELESLLNDTPAGVVEMMLIKGIGPKKVAILWKELGVESPGELLYSCNENRLVELKGFGSKTQDQIRKSIEYSLSSKGYFHYAALEAHAFQMTEQLLKSGLFSRVSLTGPIRRKCEILKCINIITACEKPEYAIEKLTADAVLKGFLVEASGDGLKLTGAEGLIVELTFTTDADFIYGLFLSTAGEKHLEQLKAISNIDQLAGKPFANEDELFGFLGLQYIEPELREGFDEIELASKNELPVLIEFNDLKGSLHNHSTYSDGLHSLKEMALACRDAGYEYLGICDHSKSAFYANGLSEERVAQQHTEIELLNKELSPFKIFKGIESDILHDGSLDYADHVLGKFDFVVASVHSGLKMSEEKATSRLLEAISNPYTTILGHPTGRLLLAREGYPINHKKIIDACAMHKVIIELNAHPYRLDLDWRWIRYALQLNVMISINPDAHQVAGFHDMYFGVCVARKGFLTKSMTFNTLGAKEVESWFNLRKKHVLNDSRV